jgi:hypothetical protein
MVFRQNEQSEGLKISWEAIPQFEWIAIDGNSACIVEIINLTVEANLDLLKSFSHFGVYP